MSTKGFMIAFLAAVAVATVVINVALYKTPVDISPVVVRKALRWPETESQNTQTLAGEVDFSETFERPLFSPTRRKFVLTPVEAPPRIVATTSDGALPEPEAAPAAPPALLGISIAGSIRKALLRGESQDAQWHQSGETIAGWIISDIWPDQVALERGGRTTRIPLYPHSSAGAEGDITHAH